MKSKPAFAHRRNPLPPTKAVTPPELSLAVFDRPGRVDRKTRVRVVVYQNYSDYIKDDPLTDYVSNLAEPAELKVLNKQMMAAMMEGQVVVTYQADADRA